MFGLLLVVHLVATSMMAGLIWFVQLVHYPLFAKVGQQNFVGYELVHQRRTAWIVGPLMLVEGLSVIAIFFWRQDDFNYVLPLMGLVMLGSIHLSTIFLQVPKHRKLSSGLNNETVTQLVKGNWIRTFGWSARTVLAAIMVLLVI